MSMEQWRAELEQLEAEQAKGFVARLAEQPKRYLFAAIGALALVAEKAVEFRYNRLEPGIDRLSERGRDVKESRLLDLKDTAAMARAMSVNLIRQAVGAGGAPFGAARRRIGIAGADDFEALSRELDALEKRLEKDLSGLGRPDLSGH